MALEEKKTKSILVVDDDELIVNLIKMNLEIEGYEVLCAYSGRQALEIVAFRKPKPDMMLLDIMMPEMDGFEVCVAMQGKRIPIIMLTAKGELEDKVMGLELGADDYIVKPFNSAELLARVSGLFRRRGYTTLSEEDHTKGIYIDLEGRMVFVNGEEVSFTPREFQLLAFLMETPDRVYSRELLLEAVWGYEYIGDSRTVDMHIQRIRKKLGPYKGCILTVFGVGYKFKEIGK